MKPQKLNAKEITEQLKSVPGWKRTGALIKRTYEFTDFVAAMAFVNHVAAVAEGMDHHPDIDIRYNKVLLAASTHSAGGLTNLDFLLARRIDG